MTSPASLQDLAAAGGSWRDDVETVTGSADPDRLALLAGLLDGPPPAGLVPPMWTQVLTPTWPAYSDLGPDGHPAHGVGLPPLPDRRRLFAGGRLDVRAALPVGSAVKRESRVTGVRATEGASGALLFVTLTHSFRDAAGTVVAVEEHDIAYRSGPATASPASARDPDPPADGEIHLTPDAVTLFRLSAITGNSHRIHYDESYARDVEGLPGRLVHGPLLALLMLELPRRLAPDRRVASYSFRLTAPVVLGARLSARRVEAGPDQWAVDTTADGVRSAYGEICFADSDEG